MDNDSSNGRRIWETIRPSKLAKFLEIEAIFSVIIGITIGLMFRTELLVLYKSITTYLKPLLEKL